MLDCETICQQMTQLSHQYERDVANFKRFSPIGRYTLSTSSSSNCDTACDTACDVVDIDFTANNTNPSLKQLLKIIHPDKIGIIFGKEIPELTKSSTKIIQDTMGFAEAVQYLYQTLPPELVDDILLKTKVVNHDIEYEANMDNHMDASFVALFREYERVRTNTLYTFIKRKIDTLFMNLQLDLTELMHLINLTLYKIHLVTHAEQKQMIREEYPLECFLENRQITLSELALHYPTSAFSKTYALIKDHVTDAIDAPIILSKESAYYHLNIYPLKTKCAKDLYAKFKQLSHE